MDIDINEHASLHDVQILDVHAEVELYLTVMVHS